MKVLICHNYYQQPGGEDVEFLSERAVLLEAGHCVLEFTRRNHEISAHNLFSKAKLGLGTTWAHNSGEDLRAVLRKERPDIAHFHNTFPLISPSAYYACQDAGVPVIQTLQNYRLLCPAATLYRDGRICEECLDHSVFHGVMHGCYRDSRPATAAVGLMLALHRRMNTWTEMVDRYVAPSEFVGRKFVQAGLPTDRISIKPNLVHPDPGMRTETGEYALYVGRLAKEKGVGTLLQAWALLKDPVPLRIVGDGPIRPALEAQRERSDLSNVHFEGRLCREKLATAMKRAAFLIFPSEWYEPFGLTIVEAFACGVPVIASRLEPVTEMLEEEKTGLYFTPCEATELAAKVEWAWRHPHEMETMGRAARAQYQAKYTAERNYAMLMEIYGQARRSSVAKILQPTWECPQ
jgi:glycosyltransferase involved in cell wall biosynthesis